MVDISLPMDGGRAGKLIREILKAGGLYFTAYCQQRLKERNMTTVDATNVLRGGLITEPCEHEGGAWRYRVHTAKFCVVVEFDSETTAYAVTAWRK